MTLRRRLALAFGIAALAPLIVGAVVVGVLVPRALQSQARARLATATAAVASLLRDLCTRAVAAAELTAGAETGPRPLDPAGLRALLHRTGVDYLVISTPTGVLGTTRPGAASAPHLGPGALGGCTGGRSRLPGALGAVVRIRSASGRPLGAVGAGLAILPGVRGFARQARLPVLVLADGRVVGRAGPAATSAGVFRAARRAIATAAPVELDGRMLAAVRTPGGQLLAMTALPPSDGALVWVLTGVVVGGLLAAAGVGWLLSRATVVPITELADAAMRIAGGDLDAGIEVRSTDEVGRLGLAFNEMTAELRERIRELQARDRALSASFDRMGETLSATLDLDSILTAVTDGAVVMTGAAAAGIYLPAGGRRLRLACQQGQAGLLERTRTSVGAVVDAHRLEVELRTGNELRGLLVLLAPGGGFPPGAADVMRRFGPQAAVAIDNVRLHAEARRLSRTDELTGLANVRALHAALDREVERATRYHHPLALLMVDLDRFKGVNDRYGHQAGDAVLATVSRRLAGCVRDIDLVGRYGGEELAILLPETDADGAAVAAARACEVVRQTPVTAGPGVAIPVTVSIGVAVLPVHAADVRSLVAAADQALYSAKRAGRDRWRVAGRLPVRARSRSG
jgi:two-component system cell cycle response regulator